MSEGKKFDGDKAPLELVDPLAIIELAEILDYGKKKYSANNWQQLDNFNDRYYAAAMRHLLAWRAGEQCDLETNKSHLAHAFCNLMFLMWKARNAKL